MFEFAVVPQRTNKLVPVPTAADLTRAYTEDELKELCLRVKCKVRMYLFNPFEDSAQRLRRQGRLQNRSERYVNKILTEDIMRNKDTALYSQEEIDRHRQFQWRERRLQNHIYLQVWNAEREIHQKKKRKLTINSQNSEIRDDNDQIDAGYVADISMTTIISGDDDSLNESNEVTNNSMTNDEEHLMQMSPISLVVAKENESVDIQTNPSMGQCKCLGKH